MKFYAKSISTTVFVIFSMKLHTGSRNADKFQMVAIKNQNKPKNT